LTDKDFHPGTAICPTAQNKRRHHKAEGFLHRTVRMSFEISNGISHLTTV